MNSMKLRLSFLCVLVLLSLQGWSQKVDWVSFDQLNTVMRDEPRPVMIFIHTDWCKFCALQETKTFTDSKVVDVLNEKIYALKLNGEARGQIGFLNKTYDYKPSGVGTGSHKLAEMLGSIDGQLSFPTTVFLNSQFQLVYRKNDFIDTATMLKYLNVLLTDES